MTLDAYLLAALADDRRRKARLVKAASLQAAAQRTHEPRRYWYGQRHITIRALNWEVPKRPA